VKTSIAAAVLAFLFAMPGSSPYGWLQVYSVQDSVATRIAPPPGFERESLTPGSFAEWLRNLPLKKGRPEVRLYDGRLKSNQDAHVAVVDIDTGPRDLQQCADAVIRLRAEYLFSRKDFADIHFNFTSGDAAHFVKWSEGFRPGVTGKRVRWAQTARPDDSYASFREYLNIVFAYAGSASLNQEMQQRTDALEVRAGDVFIEGGYPGHAVIVVDVAREARTGRRVFLLAQSYMPAQEIHILKNPASGSLGPWYDANIGQTLKTPEWTFRAEHLRRF
jgi:hypothetical protein